MINPEILGQLNLFLSLNQDESVYTIINLLLSFAQESGINKHDIIEQMNCIINTIEEYEPDPNDLLNIKLNSDV